MSGEPSLRQYRDIVSLPDGSRGFLVTAQVTDPGSGANSIPFREVFLLTIVDPLDAKADVLARIASPLEIQRASNSSVYIKLDPSFIQTFGIDPFARVANVAEYTQLARDRDTALARGQTEYLSSSVSFLYTDAVTATAAFRTIIDRISQLVLAWQQYSTGFLPNPPPFQTYTLPQVSIGVEAELKAAFSTAKTARVTAESTRDAAQKAHDACVATCQCNQQILQILMADVATLRATLDAVTPLVETATAALVLTGGTTLTSPGTYTINVAQTHVVRDFVTGSDARSVQTFFNKKAGALNNQQALVNACTASCQQLQQNLLSAQSVVTQAQAAEAAALAAVTAVCPTFDPTTV